MKCPSGLAALRRDHLLAQMMTKAKPLPPLEVVKELLDYDPKTGVLKWKNPRLSALKEIEAGHVFPIKGKSTKKYRGIKINCKYYPAHRLAWLLQTGIDPLGYIVDHIDGNGLNNQFNNLRIASDCSNQYNRGTNKNNSSGYKGVHYHCRTKKWQAQIATNGRRRYLGSFDTPELAHMAYAKAAAELHGEFARAL